MSISRHAYKRLFAVALSFATFLVTMNASAQLVLSQTGQPQEWDFRLEPYSVQGYRTARFGMTPEEVKAVIARDFPHAEVREDTDPVQRTPVLTVVVPALSPVTDHEPLGPVTLNYVFGYESGRLMAINVDWIAEGNASAEAREALVQAGKAYTASVVGYQWTPLHSARGHVVGANSVVLFAGRDPDNAGMEVRLDGVALDVLLPSGETEHRAAPAGAARLHIGLSQQPDRPDIYRLPDKAF